jgi:hypothetical protein
LSRLFGRKSVRGSSLLYFPDTVRIAISQAAFDALAATLPCSVGFEHARAPNGDWFIWLPRDVLEKLNQWRAPGESYRKAILALAEAHAGR